MAMYRNVFGFSHMNLTLGHVFQMFYCGSISGNIMNQLVYVANHNKTFETHVQVSSSYGKLQCYFQLEFISMYNLKT